MSVKQARLDKLDKAQAQIKTLESKLDMYHAAFDTLEVFLTNPVTTSDQKVASVLEFLQK